MAQSHQDAGTIPSLYGATASPTRGHDVPRDSLSNATRIGGCLWLERERERETVRLRRPIEWPHALRLVFGIFVLGATVVIAAALACDAPRPEALAVSAGLALTLVALGSHVLAKDELARRYRSIRALAGDILAQRSKLPEGPRGEGPGGDIVVNERRCSRRDARVVVFSRTPGAANVSDGGTDTVALVTPHTIVELCELANDSAAASTLARQVASLLSLGAPGPRVTVARPSAWVRGALGAVSVLAGLVGALALSNGNTGGFLVCVAWVVLYVASGFAYARLPRVIAAVRADDQRLEDAIRRATGIPRGDAQGA